MSNEIDIDELLKQDEAELRAKRKRLKAFSASLDELRSASQKAATAAAEILENGDLTRGDIAKVFALSTGERATLLPAQRRRVTDSVSDVHDQSTDASDQ